MSAENFSKSYRSELASKLLKIEDHHSQRVCLDQEKETLNFQLARGEKLAIQQGETYVSKPILDQKEFQQKVGNKYEYYYISNEPCLYKLFPVIKEQTGAIVALGSEQGFDLFVNSQASHLFMVDITEHTSLLTRTLLETGSRHKKTFGQYPNPDEFIQYFKKENNSHINRFLEPNLTPNEINQVSHLINKNRRPYSFSEPDCYRYLEYKKSVTNDENQLFSWNSSSSNLEKVFTAYDEGRIFVLKGNIGHKKTIQNIKNISQSLNCPIGTIYLSNAEEYYDTHQQRRGNLKNIMALPFSKNAVLLRTIKNGHNTIGDREKFKNSDNQGIVFRGWHYNAQTIDSLTTSKKFNFKQKIDKLCQEISPEHPEEGVSFIGIRPKA